MSLAFNLLNAFYNAPARKAPKCPPPTAFSVNDAGRDRTEHNDCSVRAWALAKGISYAEAHAAFEAAGRRRRARTSWLVSRAVMGEPTENYWGKPLRHRPTYAAWMREGRPGRWVVIVNGHAFAVINGVHLDMGPSLYKPRARVLLAWRVS